MENKHRTRPIKEQQALNSVTMFLAASFAEANNTEEARKEQEPSDPLFPFCEEDERIQEHAEGSHDEDRAGELLLQVFHLKRK
jgi:hypothetical protein